MIKGRLKSNKFFIIWLFTILFVIVSVTCVEAEEDWFIDDRTTIGFDRTKSCMIINDRGETLRYDSENDEITGNMSVSNKSKCIEDGIERYYFDEYGIDKKIYTLEIEKNSNSFTYIPLDEGETYFYVAFRDYAGAKILASNSKKIEIAKSYFKVEGEDCKYAINDGTFSNCEGRYNDENTYNIYGKTNKKICISRVLGDEAIISGIKNTHLCVNIEFLGYYGSFLDSAVEKIYSNEDVVNISHNGKFGRNLVAYGTYRLCREQYSKKIFTKYIKEVNGGRDMLFTWNEVKKAKSYIIYKYDFQTGKYNKASVINGNDNNYYLITNINSDEIYKYDVVACSDEDGKSPMGEMGKPVSAVSSNNEKGNVKKIKLNRADDYDLKKGKKLKIKATLIGEDGKQLLSKDVEWITTNNKVAPVTKNGIVKAHLRNGRGIEVWARAHNGVESKHIDITVY